MESASLAPGTLIDRYVVERRIGSGGMANVYLVRHAVLASTHALKVLTLSSPGIRERMRQEGRVQAALSHPNIVAVTDLVDVDGSPGLIMEYVDGPTLDGLIGHGLVPLDLVDELARGILAGVAAAHRHGLVHRDLKPANVLLKRVDSGLVPKVTDFGLAKVLAAGDLTGTRTGSTMGTPHYMSPEQVRDSKNVGPQSDIFALGAILYEMCTSRRAFEGSDLLMLFLAIANGDYVAPRELRPDLPDRMVDAITAALQVDTANRPTTVDALAQLWAAGTGVPRLSLENVPGFTEFARPTTQTPLFAPPSAPSDASDPPPTPPPVMAASDPSPTFADSQVDLSSRPPPPSSPPSSPSIAPGSSIVLYGVAGTALAAAIVFAFTVVGVVGAYGLARVWGGGVEASLEVPEVVDPVDVPVNPPADPPVDAPPADPADPTDPPRPADPAAPVPAAPRPSGPPTDGEPTTAPLPDPVDPPAPVPEPTDDGVSAVEPAPAPRPAPGVDLFGLAVDPDPAGRMRAVKNLEPQNNADAHRKLAELAKDRDRDVRHAAAWIVLDKYEERVNDVDVLEPAVTRIAGREDYEYAARAVRLLERFCTDPNAMAGALAHPSASIRGAAVSALAAMDARTDLDVDYDTLLARVSADPDPSVRRKVDKVRPLLVH